MNKENELSRRDKNFKLIFVVTLTFSSTFSKMRVRQLIKLRRKVLKNILILLSACLAKGQIMNFNSRRYSLEFII